MPSYIKLENMERNRKEMEDAGVPIKDICEVGVLRTIDISEEDEKDIEFKKLVSTFTGDTFSTVAKCQYGCTMGNYNLGQICQKCNTEVTAPFSKDITSLMWFKVPPGSAPLINPFVLAKISDYFKKNNFDYIKYFILSSKYVSENGNISPCGVRAANIAKKLGIENDLGRRCFVDNFFPIMRELVELDRRDPKRYQKGIELLDWLWENRGDIFTDTIPIVNKLILVVEESNAVRYVDPEVRSAIDAIDSLRRLNFSNSFKINRGFENRITKALLEITDFYVSYTKNILSPKKGKFRQGVYGFKYPYSFRCVVTPITRPHSYSEVEVPWIIGLIVLRDMILNKLIRKRYTYREATRLIAEAVYEYSPVINDIFLSLIEEAASFNRIYPEIEELSYPIKGIPMNMLRWPTLEQGSIHFYVITKITQDPLDYTIKMPPVNCKQQNGDYDGDQLGAYIHICKELADMATAFAPYNNIFNYITPDAVSNNLFMTKPTMNILATYVENDFDDMI